MRRLWILTLLLFLSVVPVYGAEPSVGALGAALVDGKTGRLLWGKNAEEEMVMASTTKIMTAIVVLENADLEEIVTVSKNAANQPEVNMNLSEGEQWRLGDLLDVMMLRSYNDVAVALAEHVSGSVEAFCAEMTQKAEVVGAVNTVFGSPNGLDSSLPMEEHHSTAYDMSLIASYALENDIFCEIIKKPAVSIGEVTGRRQVDATNADRFLSEYQGARGIKTGFTNKAGHCFVGAAERDGVELVTTVLASGWGSRGKEGKWKDTKALMEYGFATFFPYTVVEAQSVYQEELPVIRSKTTSVPILFAEGFDGLFSEEEKERLRLECQLPETLDAPIETGAVVGRVQVYLDQECLAEIPLITGGYAETLSLSDWMAYVLSQWVDWLK